MSTNNIAVSASLLLFLLLLSSLTESRTLPSKPLSSSSSDELIYLWPLPTKFTTGNTTITIDPDLSIQITENAAKSAIIKDAFDRYREIIFKHVFKFSKRRVSGYDVSKLKIIVNSSNETLNLGVDESYSLYLAKQDGLSIVGEASIEANTIYGALRGLETFSQLCAFNYGTKTVEVYKAPWYIHDEPRFAFRGLLLDTSRHYLPINVIKQVIEAMSYAKLNVLHWHIIDEESFPLEVPSYSDLWKGSYTKWERYTVEDAYDIVDYAKARGINVMAEIDVPGHAESWGTGYPDLWPSPTCREPLDVTKEFSFDVIEGILTDMRKIFPFELFHLGGDEVNTSCWNSTPHVKQWLQEQNMTAKDAYQYFVLRAQKMAISKSWTPVNCCLKSLMTQFIGDWLNIIMFKQVHHENLDDDMLALLSQANLYKDEWEETFNSFKEKLNPQTVVHNWLGSGVCPQAVAKGFRCIFSNQGVWYLDHLDVPWEQVYYSDPLEGITDASEQKLVIGGEVCMWGETADASDVQQTIWPRAAAAAARLWSTTEASFTANTSETVLPRLEYFRCLLTRRGVPASPVTNYYARRPPVGPGSCYEQ